MSAFTPAFTTALVRAARLLAFLGASTALAAAASTDTAGGVIAAMARFDRAFIPALFGFDREKTGELRKAVADIGKSLDALRAAFCEKDGEAVIKAALGLRPPCVKASLMFGDFGGLRQQSVHAPFTPGRFRCILHRNA
jgi:hypothetical protein